MCFSSGPPCPGVPLDLISPNGPVCLLALIPGPVPAGTAPAQMQALEVVGYFVETQCMAVTGDLQAIVHRLNRENARAAVRVASEQQEAYRAACELAVRMGARDPSLQRVVLFGSTVPGRRYRADSDIDLAVDGGDRALLERIAADLPQSVDIIGIDELRPGIRRRVLTEGVILYEKR